MCLFRRFVQSSRKKYINQIASRFEYVQTTGDRDNRDKTMRYIFLCLLYLFVAYWLTQKEEIITKRKLFKRGNYHINSDTDYLLPHYFKNSSVIHEIKQKKFMFNGRCLMFIRDKDTLAVLDKLLDGFYV